MVQDASDVWVVGDLEKHETQIIAELHMLGFFLLLPQLILRTVKVSEALDGVISFSTVHDSHRVLLYCAVTESSNTVSVPSVTVIESLVQVTVAAGPLVEIQVRMNRGLATLRPDSTTPSGIINSLTNVIQKR